MELTFRERNLALVWHVINTLSILIWIYTTVVMRLEYRHGLAHGWLVSAVWTIFSVFFGLSIQKFVSFGVTDDPSLWFIVAQFVLATLLAFNALIFNSGTKLHLFSFFIINHFRAASGGLGRCF